MNETFEIGDIIAPLNGGNPRAIIGIDEDGWLYLDSGNAVNAQMAAGYRKLTIMKTIVKYARIKEPTGMVAPPLPPGTILTDLWKFPGYYRYDDGTLNPKGDPIRKTIGEDWVEEISAEEYQSLLEQTLNDLRF